MSSFPLHIGAPEQFARVRDFFRRADFTEPNLCRGLGMDDMSDLGRVPWDKLDPGGNPVGAGTGSAVSLNLLPAADVESAGASTSRQDPAIGQMEPALNWCLRVFVRGLIVSEEESRQACGAEVFEALLALGLLRRADSRSGLFCPVWVYPVEEFVMASDRRDDPEGRPFTPPADVVFPAIYAGTLRFLKLLPRAAGDALDLCGGSGIGALHLARTARFSATADIAERSAFFAEFNARLNGVSIASWCGDLYAPANGRQFDFISAHPPFVPATGPNMVYRDGGDTGEEITRRIIESLPRHLRPGGTCMILCVARDTHTQLYEERVREWLGSAAAEFDLVFGLEKVLEVEGVVDSMRKRSQQMTEEEGRALLQRLRSFGTRQFVYGALFARRYARCVNQKPMRIRMTVSAVAADFERVLAWRDCRGWPGFDDWLAGARPRLAPKLELTARHLVDSGTLVPAEFVFSIRNGLEAALRPDAWLVPLVARLEGSRSVRDVYDQAKSADELPNGFALADFARLVNDLVERGFLQLEPPTGF